MRQVGCAGGEVGGVGLKVVRGIEPGGGSQKTPWDSSSPAGDIGLGGMCHAGRGAQSVRHRAMGPGTSRIGPISGDVNGGDKLGHRSSRLRQNEPFIKSRGHSRSKHYHGVVQVQPTGRHVKRVLWVTRPTEVTVISRPIELLIMPYIIDLANLFNLKPAPQHVQFRCTPDKAPTCTSFLHPPEEAEEQEYIPYPHALICHRSYAVGWRVYLG